MEGWLVPVLAGLSVGLLVLVLSRPSRKLEMQLGEEVIVRILHLVDFSVRAEVSPEEASRVMDRIKVEMWKDIERMRKEAS